MISNSGVVLSTKKCAPMFAGSSCSVPSVPWATAQEALKRVATAPNAVGVEVDEAQV